MSEIIKAVPVCRDESGYWVHPNLPDFGESVSFSVLREYANSQSFSLKIIERVEYLDPDFKEWEPDDNNPDSFLICIFESEHGDVAWFATPYSKQKKEAIKANCNGDHPSSHFDSHMSW